MKILTSSRKQTHRIYGQLDHSVLLKCMKKKIDDECIYSLSSHTLWSDFSKKYIFLNTTLLSKSILVHIISKMQMARKYFPGPDRPNLMCSRSCVDTVQSLPVKHQQR